MRQQSALGIDQRYGNERGPGWAPTLKDGRNSLFDIDPCQLPIGPSDSVTRIGDRRIERTGATMMAIGHKSRNRPTPNATIHKVA